MFSLNEKRISQKKIRANHALDFVIALDLGHLTHELNPILTLRLK